MKKRILSVLIFFLLTSVPVARAGSEKTLTLNDGTIITGRIIGIENGRYVVQSQSAGEVKIKQDNVVSITVAGKQAAPPMPNPADADSTAIPSVPINVPPGQYASQIQNMQARMMSDPELMADIQALAQDPAVISALSDPAFTQAIQSGNMQAIQASPQLQRLFTSPKLQEFIQKVRSKPQN